MTNLCIRQERIANKILMSLRQSKKQQSDVSLDEPLGTDRDGNAVSFADLLGTSPDLVEEEVRRRITLSGVRWALPTLPARERLILSLRYGLKDGTVLPSMKLRRCWEFRGRMYSAAIIVNDARRLEKRLRALLC